MQTYQTLGLFGLLGCVVVGMVLILVVSILAKVRPATPLRTRLLALGLIFLGAGFFGFAATNLYAIQSSAKITVEGTMTSLRQTQGKGHGSRFYVASVVSTPQLTTAYSGRRLQDGELVRVTFLSHTTNVTDLQVLSGPDRGWTLHEGDGTLTSLFLLAMGAFFLVLGFLGRRTRPAQTLQRRRGV